MLLRRLLECVTTSLILAEDEKEASRVPHRPSVASGSSNRPLWSAWLMALELINPG